MGSLLFLPSVYINEQLLPRVLFLTRTHEANSILKMRTAIRRLGGINITPCLRHIKHLLKYKNCTAPNKSSYNNSLRHISETNEIFNYHICHRPQTMLRNLCQSRFCQEDILQIYFIHGSLKTAFLYPDTSVYDNFPFLSVGKMFYLEKIIS